MTSPPTADAPVPAALRVLDRPGLDALLAALRQSGHTLIGPTVRDGAIVYDEIATTSDLPEGWTEEQHGGSYRLIRRVDGALFGYTVGPHSWKQFLLPAHVPVWRAARDGDGFRFEPAAPAPPRYAFLGVRSCDLAAIHIQDRVLLGGTHTDPVYRARREGAFVVVVRCSLAGNNCFCASMGAAPWREQGFDLALAELLSPGRHEFLVEAGSPAGERMLEGLPLRPAEPGELEAARVQARAVVAGMRKSLRTEGLKELLYTRYEHPRWEQVAARCLACGNCTQVCPTCFCTTVEEVTALTGAHTERHRLWDSCFSLEYSYIHGGSVRHSVRSRYRQWLTHKLGTWDDQFGTPGCVGCGRCITWCPVGIDITEEAQALQAGDRSAAPAGSDGARR
ncbi:MAG TPA: 4Fe-4S dicluster domain-containing protein [Candidatus Saccharimonadales bacterium]|nr:4Fe-4S dicluster domain-containing protein [Candidatus Saccharimonadales bacterium]